MENASLEFDCAIDDAGQTIQQIEVLADLQLALVGGGCGETVFH